MFASAGVRVIKYLRGKEVGFNALFGLAGETDFPLEWKLSVS